MTDQVIRIVLADDQPIILEGLKYIINMQEDMQIVGDASDGDEALQVILDLKPNIVLMDIQMPKLNGIEVTKRVLERLPDTKVILLTTFDFQEYVYDGIRAGAVGYLLKDTDTKELLEGIRGVYAGEAVYRSSTASKAVAQVINESENTCREDAIAKNPKCLEELKDVYEPLTDREIDVLQQMAYGRKNNEIANILNISQGTVKTHVHRIIQKLGVDERTQAVVFAIRQGIVK
jgi:DNA-binding NarL/FixJ family response regulator